MYCGYLERRISSRRIRLWRVREPCENVENPGLLGITKGGGVGDGFRW